jgi:hypothetical protein
MSDESERYYIRPPADETKSPRSRLIKGHSGGHFSGYYANEGEPDIHMDVIDRSHGKVMKKVSDLWKSWRKQIR